MTLTQVLTFTVMLPLIFGGAPEMNTVSFYAESVIEDVNFILERQQFTWSQPGTGMNDYVYAMSYDSVGNLYVGGLFTTAGGVTVNRVGKWDGVVWDDLDAGLNSYALALAIRPDNGLYVGGNFTTVGTAADAAARVAYWDGAAWAALGAGVDDIVRAMVCDRLGNLYVGGDFANAGGAPAAKIAMWDGAAWSTLSTGMNGSVYALAVDAAGNLYAGGAFTTAGGTTVNRIAKWNGTAWVALGTGMDASVYALAIGPDGMLYAGGAFTTANGNAAKYLARWDGVTWTAMVSSINGGVFALDWYGHEHALYIGGIFSEINGINTVNRLVKWSNNSFIPMSFDLYGNPTIQALASHDNRLAFGFGAASVGDCKLWGEGEAIINNAGTVAVGCKFIVSRSGGTSAKLVSITNYTTGASILFDWAMMDGETITIDLTGAQKTVNSSITGNQLSKILKNSNFTDFRLEPGVNDIGVYISSVGSPTLTAYIQWETQYLSVDGSAQ